MCPESLVVSTEGRADGVGEDAGCCGGSGGGALVPAAAVGVGAVRLVAVRRRGLVGLPRAVRFLLLELPDELDDGDTDEDERQEEALDLQQERHGGDLQGHEHAEHHLEHVEGLEETASLLALLATDLGDLDLLAP